MTGQTRSAPVGAETCLVSTLGLEPELFLLTTGTFNLVVKDRRRCPPERGVFSPAKSFRANADARTLWNLAVLETF